MDSGPYEADLAPGRQPVNLKFLSDWQLNWLWDC